MEDVTIFWDGDGWYFVARHERVGPADRLHDACVSAINAGFTIAGVNGTRGMLPARSPALSTREAPENS